MSKTHIHTEHAPQPVGPYSQATKIGGMLFLAGQIGLNTKGEMAEGFVAQARQVFANVKAVLAADDLTLDHVVKLTVYLADLNRTPDLNAIMQEVFSNPYPARVTIEVSRLPLDALIEVDAHVHAL